MKHTLLIREADKRVFDSIKSGAKDIETRAATEKYRKIKPGDILEFICGDERLEKEVVKIELFPSIKEMFDKIDYKKIMPFTNSADEAEAVYYSFPGYKEKIAEFGLIAFWMK